jgi:diadenosine tetraphosphate (Ap4A) HIT family hydrolase
VERLRAGPKVVVLPSVDESGRPLGSKRPSQAVDAAEDSRAAGKRPAQGDARPAPAAPAAPQGAAERDEKARRDLRNLVEAERAADGADMDEYYARAVLSNESFGKLDTDAQFELAEDAMRGFDRRRAKAAARDAGDMDRRRAIAVVQRSDAVVQACPLCVESPRHQSHLVVATGLRVYLALPQRGSVCEGHCILAPVEHVLAQTQMDEDVHEELVYFQKHLAKMFAKRGKRVIFLEQTNLHGKRHCQVECVPLSEDEFAEAPMYFRKAILESDEEWAQNKRLVETNGRGIRKSVPSGFSYFFVEFGVGGDGYAHVIEDISQFPLDMGREVVCGVLGEPAQLVMHARRESRHAEVEAVRGFREMWRPFDWTIKLRKGVVQRPPKQPLPQQEQAEERAAAPLHSGSSDAGPAGGDDRG